MPEMGDIVEHPDSARKLVAGATRLNDADPDDRVLVTVIVKRKARGGFTLAEAPLVSRMTAGSLSSRRPWNRSCSSVVHSLKAHLGDQAWVDPAHAGPQQITAVERGPVPAPGRPASHGGGQGCAG